ncbi:MAG TPA: hypothetical protein VN366_03360 [Feifaniaceae bacterium]|nr:hypothetical protein [Feifaniaceae bacterium]
MKRKLISFLSVFILSAVLASPTLAAGEAPGRLIFVRAEAGRTHRQKSPLDAKAFVDGLVTDNVIPRETGDKLLTYLSQKREAHKAEREKLKSMTEDERKAYLEEQKAKREADGPFAELVKDGTLTREQAETIAKALREYRKK